MPVSRGGRCILFIENDIGYLFPIPAVMERLDWLITEVELLPYISLFREPVHVPSAGAFNVANDELKRVEIQSRDSVKSHIEQYQSPFEEGVGGICCPS